jgi:hypothetical protein
MYPSTEWAMNTEICGRDMVWIMPREILPRHKARGFVAADQSRATRLRRRREGSVREGAATQGLLPQRTGTRLPRRVLEDISEVTTKVIGDSAASVLEDLIDVFEGAAAAK